jgi:hypothetical protein
LLALLGVRRSKTRKWLSELTLLSKLGLCGLHAAEYVHECVGSVVREEPAFGSQIFIVPSHDEERNVDLETRL